MVKGNRKDRELELRRLQPLLPGKMSTLAAKWENHTSIPHDLRRETSNYDPRVFYWKNQPLNNLDLGGHRIVECPKPHLPSAQNTP